MNKKMALAAVALTVALSGCAEGPLKGLGIGVRPGDADLTLGVRNYENGDYAVAAKNLQDALNSGVSRDDQVTAHKYLAFIHCVSQKARLCRDEFKKALDLNPKFDLAPAEAGHPVWGPVFKTVKAEAAKGKDQK